MRTGRDTLEKLSIVRTLPNAPDVNFRFLVLAVWVFSSADARGQVTQAHRKAAHRSSHNRTHPTTSHRTIAARSRLHSAAHASVRTVRYTPKRSYPHPVITSAYSPAAGVSSQHIIQLFGRLQERLRRRPRSRAERTGKPERRCQTGEPTRGACNGHSLLPGQREPGDSPGSSGGERCKCATDVSGETDVSWGR